MISDYHIYMRETISLWVEATENKQIYRSANITVQLKELVKLDPPKQNIRCVRKNGLLWILWDREYHHSMTPAYYKDVQHKQMGQSDWKEVPCITGTAILDNKNIVLSNCQEDNSMWNTCTEFCLVALEKDIAHQIQIRHKYTKGLWSDWSYPIFLPAAIGQSPKANITVYKSSKGRRKLVLQWQRASEEHGNVTYNVNLVFLPCHGEPKSHQNITEDWFSTSISGGAYNLTVWAFNSAEYATPWSSVIEEDYTGESFESVNLLGNNTLKVEWSQQTSKARYCIEWKPTSTNDISSKYYIVTNEGKNATIITADFHPMQCYCITAYQISGKQRTVGKTYYLKPSLNIGPGNLTVVNLTADSVYLKWEGFDLGKCEGLLKFWVVTMTNHDSNTTKEFVENSSERGYHARNLTLGSHYTFNVKAITMFGEHTGSIQKSIATPKPAVNTNNMWLPVIIVGIILGFVIAPGLCCFTIRRFTTVLCPALPDPKHSNAIMFHLIETEHSSHPIHLIDAYYEDGPEHLLTVEPVTEHEPSMVPDNDINNWIITKDHIKKEQELKFGFGNDLPFEYRRQMNPISSLYDNAEIQEESSNIENKSVLLIFKQSD
uniref:Fibronectin type-III domain-containing protein n=1 Tax=Leptobrachium leishanense TaxID=445787 RepID=A0A8C5LXF2_9ANUR